MWMGDEGYNFPVRRWPDPAYPGPQQALWFKDGQKKEEVEHLVNSDYTSDTKLNVYILLFNAYSSKCFRVHLRGTQPK